MPEVHSVFPVSQLKKCLKVPTDVIINDVTPLEADLSYSEQPIKVLDWQEHVMRRKTIKFYKVQWSHHQEREATWETGEFIRSNYPNFLPPQVAL
jgi:hypothetical protein